MLFRSKKKKILPFVTTWMELAGTMLREINQTEKDRYHMISLICGILKKKMVNYCKQRTDWWLPQAGVGGRRNG